MGITRRTVLKATALGVLTVGRGAHLSFAQATGGGAIEPADRVFIANEDSNTISVIDPQRNAVDTTINLTSFDEDPRPPFRFVTGGAMPAHAAMIHKPLYHGAIDVHGVVPSPDGTLLATAGRGSSNLYLIDTVAKKVVGNTPNPLASPTTNPDRLTTGVLIGREPHEPTFTRNGKEIWVAVRGEDRIAILDVEGVVKASAGAAVNAVRMYLPTINGPAQVWFSADGGLAFVASQKVPRVDVFQVRPDAQGYSQPSARSPWTCRSGQTRLHAFSQDVARRRGGLVLSQARGSSVGSRHPRRPPGIGRRAARQPGETQSSGVRPERQGQGDLRQPRPRGRRRTRRRGLQPDRHPRPHGAVGGRKVVKTFFTHGREAHGLWTNPTGALLYVAHEQDELPSTPTAGQTVCSAFDVSDPFDPLFLAQIPLGSLKLPSGDLRNKKSINLVYVRPGAKSQSA